jgi:hypothetical protein
MPDVRAVEVNAVEEAGLGAADLIPDSRHRESPYLAVLSAEQRPKILAALAAVATVSVLAVVTYLLVANGGKSHDTAGLGGTSATQSASEESPVPADSTTLFEPSPTPSPTQTGTVEVATAVTDGRATDIAAMFNTYFDGIKSKQYQAAASVFDPAGQIDPNDPTMVDIFAKGLETSTDSEIVLREIADAPDGTVRAVVTFLSHQAPGYGPKGREQETCTRWSVAYSLSQSTAAGYRILRSKGTSSPCPG